MGKSPLVLRSQSKTGGTKKFTSDIAKQSFTSTLSSFLKSKEHIKTSLDTISDYDNDSTFFGSQSFTQDLVPASQSKREFKIPKAKGSTKNKTSSKI